jgi:hypothetical protein
MYNKKKMMMVLIHPPKKIIGGIIYKIHSENKNKTECPFSIQNIHYNLVCLDIIAVVHVWKAIWLASGGDVVDAIHTFDCYVTPQQKM